MKVTVTVIRQYITNRFREYESMASALGPPIKQKYKPKLPRLAPVDITAGAAITEGGKGREDEVDELVKVGEVGEEARVNGLIRYTPQMGTLDVLRLETKNMRDRPSLVLFVSQRNKHKILMLWAPARGLVPPANWTLSQLCQTYASVASD